MRGTNWAQRGAFSPELREERRKAYAAEKAEREARRCPACKKVFKTVEEKNQHADDARIEHRLERAKNADEILDAFLKK